MAKSTPRGGRGQPARAAAKSKKAAASDVEVSGEEKPGIGFEAGVAILTSVVLIAALVLVDKMQGLNADGIFFNP